MKNWIRRYLGIDEMHMDILAAKRAAMEIKNVHTNLRATNLAVGRIVAKLDPTFAESEFDPARKAASDAAGNTVIQRLLGEDHYSNRTRTE